jgi:hypothetical protein
MRPRRAKLTHEAPVLEGEALLQRVERQVAAGTLGVVEGGRHLGAGRLEATAGDEGGGRSGAESSTGEHLGQSAGGAIGAAASVLWRCGRVERCRCGWSDAGLLRLRAPLADAKAGAADAPMPALAVRCPQLFVICSPSQGRHSSRALTTTTSPVRLRNLHTRKVTAASSY